MSENLPIRWETQAFRRREMRYLERLLGTASNRGASLFGGGILNKKGLTALAGMAVVAVSFAGTNVADAAGTAGAAVAKVSIKVTPNPATHTTPVELFSAVRPFPASTTAPHPTGSVCFFDGAATTPLICGLLKVSVQGVSSTRVSFTLAAGSHAIQARYSGDTTYAANASKALLVTVS